MIQVGTPHEIYESPAAPEVAAFIGRCNFLTGRVAEHRGAVYTIRLDTSDDIVTVESEQHVEVNAAVTVAIRPERLEVMPLGSNPEGQNRLRTEVLTSSYVGSRYEYDVRLGNQVVQVLSARSGLTGEAVLVFEPAKALLFPEQVAAL